MKEGVAKDGLLLEGLSVTKKRLRQNLRYIIDKENRSRKEISCVSDLRKPLEYRDSHVL